MHGGNVLFEQVNAKDLSVYRDAVCFSNGLFYIDADARFYHREDVALR